MTESRAIKEAREIKRKIAINPDQEYGTYIFAVAIARDDFLNGLLRIPTRTGDPISNEVHDIVRDCYFCHGVAFLDLGEIPVSYRLVMDDAIGWEVDVPIPFSVVKRYLGQEQKLEFERWKQQYSTDSHDIKFLQVKCVF